MNEIIFLGDIIVNSINSNETDDSITNKSEIYDTGHPVYADKDLVNGNDDGAIYCRGYASCAGTNKIQTQNGNIFCIACQTCMDSAFIWASESTTIDDSDTNTNTITNTNNNNNNNNISTITNSTAIEETDTNGHIFCLSFYSCSESILDTGNEIICSAVGLCRNSVILNAKKGFCSVYSCVNSIIRGVETMYIVGGNVFVVIYSGNVGNAYIYLKGPGAGHHLTYHCEEDDTCYINCDMAYTNGFACNSRTTSIYCDGKCVISCNYVNYTDNYSCLNIEESISPTAAPTLAPTTAPSQPPTLGDAPIVLLTESVLSLWLNWIIGLIFGVAMLVIVLGILDAKVNKQRINELFQWTSILVFCFYTSDFFSDVFFTLRLAVLTFDDEVSKYDDYYMTLFILSTMFLVIPLLSNIVQLYFEGVFEQRDVLELVQNLYYFKHLC